MAMGGRTMIVMMMVVVGLLHNAEAKTYQVGNSGSNGGWTFASSDSQYDDQFKNITLVPGDVLTFSFTTGSHNVYQVLPANVASCDASNSIFNSNSSVNITLPNAGDYGFICEFPDHCNGSFMHLSVTVQASAAPSPASPAPAKAPSTTAPSPAPEAPSAPAPAPKSPAPESPSTPAPSPASKAPSAHAPAPAKTPSADAPTPGTSAPGGPDNNAASFVRSGQAMIFGVLLATGAVMFL